MEFQILPVHKDDYPLSGFSWNGILHYDRCIKLRFAPSCLTLKTYTTVLEWVPFHKVGLKGNIQILDDFRFLRWFLDECKKKKKKKKKIKKKEKKKHLLNYKSCAQMW